MRTLLLNSVSWLLDWRHNRTRIMEEGLSEDEGRYGEKRSSYILAWLTGLVLVFLSLNPFLALNFSHKSTPLFLSNYSPVRTR